MKTIAINGKFVRRHQFVSWSHLRSIEIAREAINEYEKERAAVLIVGGCLLEDASIAMQPCCVFSNKSFGYRLDIAKHLARVSTLVLCELGYANYRGGDDPDKKVSYKGWVPDSEFIGCKPLGSTHHGERYTPFPKAWHHKIVEGLNKEIELAFSTGKLEDLLAEGRGALGALKV